MYIGRIIGIRYEFPPVGYGGVERTTWDLTERQIELGTSIDVYTVRSSRSSAHIRYLFELPSSSLEQEAITKAHGGVIARWLVVRGHSLKEITHCAWAMETASHNDYDLVHVHTLDALWFAHSLDKPLVATVHDHPGHRAIQELFRTIQGKNIHLVFPSYRSRQLSGLMNASVIHHGINLAQLPFSGEKDDFCLFVGRLCYRKGPDLAIRTALRCGRRIILIGPGPDTPPDIRFVAREVQPLIDNDRVIYLGEMGTQRLDWIKRASAVLVPIRWDEPFGRIVIEALGCGTPVVGLRKGALPELVTDSVGRLVDSEVALETALLGAIVLNPQDCRRHAEERFSDRRMADDYINLYQRLLS